MASETSQVLQALSLYQDAFAAASSIASGSQTVFKRPRRESGIDSEAAAKRSRVDVSLDAASYLLAADTSTDLTSDDDETPAEGSNVSVHQEAFAALMQKSIFTTDYHITVKEGLRKLKLSSLTDVIPGMQVRLMKHQIIGVAWMLHREVESKDRGGILADEMGLGKTVQMIATMTINAADPYSNGPRITLIVVPVALLHQWKEEIETKTNDMFRVHIQHGRTKLRFVEELEQYDVIITSYHTLNFDFIVPQGLEDFKQDRYIAEHGGVLSQLRYYRVILDEAQYIRNRRTISSQAVARLDSKYRWMLTGTPVTNTLTDLYGLLRFGKFRPWNDWFQFEQYVARIQIQDPPLAGQRAQDILRPLLLRRTKGEKLEGEPLLKLPAKNVDIVSLEFSAEERSIYEDFQKRAQVQINRFIKHGDLTKNSHVILVMILRLRQLCCHPNLILTKGESYEDPALLLGGDTVETDRSVAKATKIMGRAWVAEVKKRFLSRAKLQMASSTTAMTDADLSCPRCTDYFMNGNARILECMHEICSECLEDLIQSPIEVDNNNFQQSTDAEIAKAEKEFDKATRTGARPCPKCRNYFSPQKVFCSQAFEPVEMEDDDPPPPRSTYSERMMQSSMTIDLDSDSDLEMPSLSDMLGKSKPAQSLAKNKASTSKALQDSDASDDEAEQATAPAAKPSKEVLATWTRSSADVEPSAKMVALIEMLKQWDLDSNSQDKSICYSQWTSMLDLVETLLQRERMTYLRYDGKMDKDSREAALMAFKNPDGPRLILISTKSGSVGLNLVSANRIVNLDLSWNYASEAQAYDRVHRVGQTKEVFVKRFVVKDTIEERMLRIQDLKLSLADAALGEGTGGQKLNKMSVKEIRALFGMEKF